MRSTNLSHQFVETFPDRLDPGILYISMEYASVSHLCCCGCGAEIVTPLSPTDWKLSYDGVAVSLFPSIGSWSLKCRSHYFVRDNQVVWAAEWTDEQIRHGRSFDRSRKAMLHGKIESFAGHNETLTSPKNQSIWKRLLSFFT